MGHGDRFNPGDSAQARDMGIQNPDVEYVHKGTRRETRVYNFS